MCLIEKSFASCRVVWTITIQRFNRPQSDKAAASPLRNEKSHFEWRRSPHVVFGHCPGLGWLRSIRQLSFNSRQKRAVFENINFGFNSQFVRTLQRRELPQALFNRPGIQAAAHPKCFWSVVVCGKWPPEKSRGSLPAGQAPFLTGNGQILLAIGWTYTKAQNQSCHASRKPDTSRTRFRQARSGYGHCGQPGDAHQLETNSRYVPARLLQCSLKSTCNPAANPTAWIS